MLDVRTLMTRDELIKRIIRDNSDTYIAQMMRDAAVKVACGVRF